MTARPFTSQAVVRSGVARVTLVGELDWDSAPYVREAVAACLEERPTTLCVDLTGVSFCDCAGLNALLGARIWLLGQGVEFLVEGVGTQPARLLALLGADGVLVERNTHPDAEPARCAPGAVASPPVPAVDTAESLLRDLLA